MSLPSDDAAEESEELLLPLSELHAPNTKAAKANAVSLQQISLLYYFFPFSFQKFHFR